MSTRRLLTVAVFAVGVFAVIKLWPSDPGGDAGSRTSAGSTDPANPATAPIALPDRNPADAARPKSPGVAASAGPTAPAFATFAAEDFPIVAPLNQPGSTLARDLATVAAVLDAWRTSFPREGNPVGENADITAALAGANPLGLVLIPKQHPAINAQGELCDRWGTPFRFHQLSGEHMEIRSAGPDRKFATPDDGRWQPLPGEP